MTYSSSRSVGETRPSPGRRAEAGLRGAARAGPGLARAAYLDGQCALGRNAGQKTNGTAG